MLAVPSVKAYDNKLIMTFSVARIPEGCSCRQTEARAQPDEVDTLAVCCLPDKCRGACCLPGTGRVVCCLPGEGRAVCCLPGKWRAVRCLPGNGRSNISGCLSATCPCYECLILSAYD